MFLQEALDQFGSWLDQNGADEAPSEYLHWLEDSIRSSKVPFGEVLLFDISTNPGAEAGWQAVTKRTMLEKTLSYLNPINFQDHLRFSASLMSRARDSTL